MKADGSSARRRVWRMTAENQLGEVLELVPAKAPGRRGSAAPAARPSAAMSAGSTSGEQAVEHARADESTIPPSERIDWQSSSYDLLQGLRIRDVSDKLPPRMFDALFGPDPAPSQDVRDGVDSP